MRSNYFAFLFLISSVLGFANPCIDINFSPYCGAENIVFLQNGLERIENLIFPVPKITLEDLENREECPHFSRKQRWFRQSRSLLIGIPSNASCAIAQHEVFGHGYRVRGLGSKYAKVTGYKISPIGGETLIQITNHLTVSQNLTIDVAGLEADAILANRVRLGWLDKGRIDGRQGMLYLMSSLSFTGYTFSINGNPKNVSEANNDISSFLFFLNAMYRDGQLSHAKVRNLSLLNLLNPFIYYAVISQWNHDAVCLPSQVFMFSIGSVKYLPSIRVALTPFGTQGYFESFFLIDSVPTYLYLKWGKNGPNNYWGFGCENQRILNWSSLALGLRMDIWEQPNVLFQPGALSVEEIYKLPEGMEIPELYPTSVLNAKTIGGAFSLVGSFGSENLPVRLILQLGYKTDGYLPGEALRESPIVRGGLSGKF